MKKRAILHLEDAPEWIEHVQHWLHDSYDVYSAKTSNEAAQLCWEMAATGLRFDLAIVDISLSLGNSHNNQGLDFIEALEESGVLLGHNIIILSGYADIDQNMRTAFRDYNAVDVFDKGDFPEAIEEFIKVVDSALEHIKHLELLQPLDIAWARAIEELESPQQFVSIAKQVFESSFGMLVIDYNLLPSNDDDFVVFSLKTETVFESMPSLANIPIIFCRFNDFKHTEIDSLQRILSDLPTDFSRITLLILFTASANSNTFQVLLDNKINKVYAYDVTVMNKEELGNIVTSENPLQSLRRFILGHVDLSNVSPYIITGPTDTSMFVGREGEIREITEHVLNTSFAVIGGRRMGKSSLLMHLHQFRFPVTGFCTLYHDCSSTPTYNDFLKARTHYWKPKPPSNTVITFKDLLQSSFSEQAVVLLLDEADKLIPSDQSNDWVLFSTLRSFVYSGRVQIIFGGERTLHKALRDPTGPLFNFANEVLLGPLNYQEVSELVIRPMKQLGIQFENELKAVENIYNFTSGHPNIVQRLCRRLIERLNELGTRRITLDDVEAIIEDPGFQRDDFLSTYWEAATPLERIISLLLANDKNVRTLRAIRHALAEHCNLHPKAREVDDALQCLVDLRSILKRTPAGYEFAVEAFPRVVAGTMTLDDMLEILTEEYRGQSE